MQVIDIDTENILKSFFGASLYGLPKASLPDGGVLNVFKNDTHRVLVLSGRNVCIFPIEGSFYFVNDCPSFLVNTILDFLELNSEFKK